MASSWSNVRSSGNSRIHAGPDCTTTIYERGRTPAREQEVDGQLLGAARSDSEERVKGLINVHGAHPWCADPDGMTPLHHACASEHDNTGILELLIGNGADLDAVNKAGESPLRVAINKKGPYSAKANYIRRRGGKDIGPRAVQLVHTGPPASAPQPAPQNYNPHNYNFARDLQISLDQKFPFLRSTPPQLVSLQSEDASSHRPELERIAARFDLLDDYKPPEFYGLPPADISTVLSMVQDKKDEARDARQQRLREMLGGYLP